MTTTIITSHRYIAIRFDDGSLAPRGILRILTKDNLIYPARWNASNRRLECCARNSAPVPLPMYEKSHKTEANLAAAKINFAWLTLDEAKALAS